MHNNIFIKIPKEVNFIINKLEKAGYKAYIVGGCVRDSILKRIPNDWDICTSAKPNEIVELFDKVIPTGIQHGTVTIMVDGVGYEVTTFRIDNNYEDNRHPSNVKFIDSVTGDLSRRDFTINAMAYNDSEGLVDPSGGIEDIENKIIRTVGNSTDRFNEDALRMLRAIRFSAQLDFIIDKNVEKAILDLHEKIRNISIERIRNEFEKIILFNPMKINSLLELNLLQYIIPELLSCVNCTQQNPYHIYDVYNHLINSCKNIENEIDLKLVMILHDICKPECKTTDSNNIDHFYDHAEKSYLKSINILKRLKCDNKTIDKVSTLIKYHDREIKSKKSIRKLLNLIGEENLRDLLKVKIADIKSQNPKYLHDRLNSIKKIELSLNEIIEDRNCFSLKDLKMNGLDLIKLGIPKGKQIGKYLNELLELVLDDPKKNNKEFLSEYINKKIKGEM